MRRWPRGYAQNRERRLETGLDAVVGDHAPPQPSKGTCPNYLAVSDHDDLNHGSTKHASHPCKCRQFVNHFQTQTGDTTPQQLGAKKMDFFVDEGENDVGVSTNHISFAGKCQTPRTGRKPTYNIVETDTPLVSYHGPSNIL